MVRRLVEDLELDERTRAWLGGDFARLSDGFTHYRDEGPRDGEAVVLVHGGTLPSEIFAGTAQDLVAAGFRVVRFDGFGRGRSDRPRLRHDLELFRRQLGDLLDHLDIARCRLVGYSLGAPVAASFATHSPRRVEKVALVAPVVRYSRHRALVALAGLPWVGRAVMRTVGMARVEARTRECLDRHEEGERCRVAFHEQLRIRGSTRSMSSMSWHMVRRDFTEDYRRFATVGIETRILRGSADEEVHAREVEGLLAAVPHATYVEHPGGTHTLLLDPGGPIRAELVRALRTATSAPRVRFRRAGAEAAAGGGTDTASITDTLELVRV